MNAYDLPTSLTIGGVERQIRSGWRVIMDILEMFDDPDLDGETKAVALLQIFYPGWAEIPAEHLQEAVEKACEFIDCGIEPDGKHHPRVVDWQKDASIIIPAVNTVAKREVRTDPNIHWWTFFGWYMNIESSLFSSVLNIRQKKASGKKLEKWETEFYQKNRSIIDIKPPESKEERETKDSILKWL